jgi:transcriptional regulator with XRE-family HTH domain
MDDELMYGPLEVGQYLARVRDRAGLKQAELARLLNWSQAVLSRVESGERVATPEELQLIAETIGSEDAQRLVASVKRDWRVVPRPSLDHPDVDLLWEADQAAAALVELSTRDNTRPAFLRRLDELTNEIRTSAANLLRREHQVAFVGAIGIGKSSAICRLTGLEIPDSERGLATPVLEAGAGGITVCEVHMRTGPGYGLIIAPRTAEEIRGDVTDFAEHLLQRLRGTGSDDDADNEGNESQGISKEIERAVRNMANLKIRRDKGSDGKTIRRDEAKELATRFPTVRELVVEILARMELHRRDRRDIWHGNETGKSALVWLKDIFEEINNGRHPEFTLPKRIEVVVPFQLLGESDLSIRIVDTKGVDRPAARADLESHLDDPHTQTVLCSGFNNAPAQEAQLILKRARESGVRRLQNRASVLVLPRAGEALAMKDESGIRAESVDEGYELKGEQIAMNLQPLGMQDMAVEFYNAHQDDPARLRDFLKRCLEKSRQALRASLHEITLNAGALLLNHERAQVQEVVRHAATMLGAWTERQKTVRMARANVQDSLMDEMARVYASTIRAAVRREGVWPNLDYSYHLGFGARRLAAMSLGDVSKSFVELCQTMKQNPEFAEAKDFLDQAERLLELAYDDLLRKVQLMGISLFQEELKVDTEFWARCAYEWGNGPGYRDRVTRHNRDWFQSPERQNMEEELHNMVQREWSAVVARISGLFVDGGASE